MRMWLHVPAGCARAGVIRDCGRQAGPVVKVVASSWWKMLEVGGHGQGGGGEAMCLGQQLEPCTLAPTRPQIPASSYSARGLSSKAAATSVGGPSGGSESGGSRLAAAVSNDFFLLGCKALRV